MVATLWQSCSVMVMHLTISPSSALHPHIGSCECCTPTESCLRAACQSSSMLTITAVSHSCQGTHMRRSLVVAHQSTCSMCVRCTYATGQQGRLVSCLAALSIAPAPPLVLAYQLPCAVSQLVMYHYITELFCMHSLPDMCCSAPFLQVALRPARASC